MCSFQLRNAPQQKNNYVLQVDGAYLLASFISPPPAPPPPPPPPPGFKGFLQSILWCGRFAFRCAIGAPLSFFKRGFHALKGERKKRSREQFQKHGLDNLFLLHYTKWCSNGIYMGYLPATAPLVGFNSGPGA